MTKNNRHVSRRKALSRNERVQFVGGGSKLAGEDILHLHGQRLIGRFAVGSSKRASVAHLGSIARVAVGGELDHFHLRRCDRLRRAVKLVSCLLPATPLPNNGCYRTPSFLSLPPPSSLAPFNCVSTAILRTFLSIIDLQLARSCRIFWNFLERRAPRTTRPEIFPRAGFSVSKSQLAH